MHTVEFDNKNKGDTCHEFFQVSGPPHVSPPIRSALCHLGRSNRGGLLQHSRERSFNE